MQRHGGEKKEKKKKRKREGKERIISEFIGEHQCVFGFMWD